MKKELPLILSLLIISILPLSSAEYSCSDGSEVEWSQKEADVGSTKIINTVGIGVKWADEVTVFNRYIAELIIDARSFSLYIGETEDEVDLKKGTYKIGLVNITNATTKIEIDGSSKGFKEEEISTLKGLYVLVTSSDEGSQSAEFIVGSEQLTLQNDVNPIEEKVFGNKTFLIELISASETGATIRVSSCKTGVIQEETISETTNETINETISETTNETTNETINETTTETTETTTTETTTTETTSNETQPAEQTTEKPTIFREFINWIKRIFGLD